MSRVRVPIGLPEIIQTFGDICDPDFEKKYIVMFNLPYTLYFNNKPVTRARCHRLLVDTFTRVFEEIKSSGIALQYADDYSGIYNPRPVRGMPKYPSTHSWGIAIDIEAHDNPLGSSGKMHPRVVEIFRANGFFWGGHFKHRRDPMHFQYALKY